MLTLKTIESIRRPARLCEHKCLILDVPDDFGIEAFSLEPANYFPTRLKINGVDYEWSENPEAYLNYEEKVEVQQYWTWLYHKTLQTPDWEAGFKDQPEPRKKDEVRDWRTPEWVIAALRVWLAVEETKRYNMFPRDQEAYFRSMLGIISNYGIQSLQAYYFLHKNIPIKTGLETWTLELEIPYQ